MIAVTMRMEKMTFGYTDLIKDYQYSKMLEEKID